MTQDANPFDKVGAAEDRDGNGIVDTMHPSIRWLLWVSDALTVFTRGLLAGIFPGVAGGTAAVISIPAKDATGYVINAAAGFAFGLIVKGLERFHKWQDKPENEMPNPFRVSSQNSPDA